MNPLDSGLTAEDHAYRRAAETYFDEKGRVARAGFDAKLLDVFASFEEHWRGFFAPSDPGPLREYLATPFEVRKAQFERFRRECRAWEVSFRHCARRPGAEARPGAPSGGGNGNGSAAPGATDWKDLKRRLDEHRSKQEQVREFYDNLDAMLDRERQRRSHPIELLAHLRVLGVAQDATLEDIKKQYRRLAKLHHPDRQGDSLKMGRLADAYRAILAYYRVGATS